MIIAVGFWPLRGGLGVAGDVLGAAPLLPGAIARHEIRRQRPCMLHAPSSSPAGRPGTSLTVGVSFRSVCAAARPRVKRPLYACGARVSRRVTGETGQWVRSSISLRRTRMPELDTSRIIVLRQSLGDQRCREIVEEVVFHLTDRLGLLRRALDGGDRGRGAGPRRRASPASASRSGSPTSPGSRAISAAASRPTTASRPAPSARAYSDWARNRSSR